MKATNRPTRLNVELLELKGPWLAYCRRRNVTPSAAFRQVVAKLTGADNNPEDAEAAPADAGKIRRQIRLTAQELALAEATAHREGIRLTHWLSAVVCARLGGAPQLGSGEMEALCQSNLMLLGLVRQLTKLAQAHTGENEKADMHLLLERTHQLVTRHTRHVASVLSANANRWRQT